MILVIHSYPKANQDVARHLPYWQAAGFNRLVGVATEGGGCKFPETLEHVTIGRDVYIDGDALPRRWADTVEWMLGQPEWEDACIINADTVIMEPLPSVVDMDGFHAILAGELDYCGVRKKFYHNPVLANRKTWVLLLKHGRQMIAEGDIEGGYPDFWAAKLCARFGIPVFTNTFYGYTDNTIQTAVQIRAARAAYLNGCRVFHGVKSDKVLRRILGV